MAAQEHTCKSIEGENENEIEEQLNSSTNLRSLTTNYLSYTDETIVKRVYKLARILPDALVKSGIKYWASSGTLLGCVRHKGLIPWDDDLDLCIYSKDLPKLDRLKHLLNISNYEMLEALELGYIIVFHKTESQKLPFEHQKHRYPFGDIFVMERKNNITQIAAAAGRARWPQEYYNNEDIDNLESRLYGDVYLNCPANPEKYFEREYGKQWFTHGTTHNISHITQQYANPVSFKLSPENYHPVKPFR